MLQLEAFNRADEPTQQSPRSETKYSYKAIPTEEGKLVEQSIWGKYDITFLYTYCLQYFNGGLKFLLMLSIQDLFKNYFQLQPSKTQILIVFIMSPWLLKIIFGIISDTVPVCGSRKKSWLIIMGFVQFFSLAVVASVKIDSVNVVSNFLMLSQLSGSFMDTIVDAMMVIQAKKDPKHGSQQLQALGYGVSACAAIVGGLTAAFVLQSYTPYVCFGIYSIFGVVVALSALLLTKAQEEDQTSQIEHQTFCEVTNHNYIIFRECLKEPPMHRSLLYFLLFGLTVPHFGDFMYYFKTEVLGFSQMTYSLITLIGACSLLFGVILYHKFFSHLETRSLYKVSIAIHMIATVFDLILVLRWNLKVGIPDIWWIIFSSSSLGTLQFAFGVLPAMVLFSKITPAHVEATMFAFTSSVISIVFPLSKLIGALWNSLIFHVTFTNLEELYKLYLLQLLTLCLPFFYLGLIPSWAEIRIIQEGQRVTQKEAQLII